MTCTSTNLSSSFFVTSILHKTEPVVAMKFIKNSQLHEKLVKHKVYSKGLIKAYIHYLKHFCIQRILKKLQ